jgi:dTDP-4-amino-4,6-dideoxygalactose transaminase
MIKLIKPVLPDLHNELISSFEDIYESGIYTNGGQFYDKFCNKLERMMGLRNTIITSNGTLSLYLALITLSETPLNIAVPSFTFYGTIQAIYMAKHNPILFDIDKDTLTLSVDALKRKYDEYDAILAVDSFGNPCHYQEILSLGKPVIFDSAGSLGAMYDNEVVGKFGDYQCFSLHATKLLPVGEGGLITCKTEESYNKIKSLINFGLEDNKLIHKQGSNCKIDEFRCAIGYNALDKLEEHITNRTKYIECYKNNLSSCVVYQKLTNDNNMPTHQLFPVIFPNKKIRDTVKQHLDDNDIGNKIYYNPWLKYGALPNTRLIHDRILCLPIHSIMDEDDILTVCQKVNECL